MLRRSVCLSPDDRRTRLHAVADALRRRFGPHILRLGTEFIAAREQRSMTAQISTGSLALDLIVGGLPPGSIVEYAGVEGAGTETLALAALAACQQRGGLVLLVDCSGSADGASLMHLGIDLEQLTLLSPGTAVEAWEVLFALLRADVLDLILATLPDLLSLPGGDGRYRLSRVLPRLALTLRSQETVLLFVNRPLLLWRGPGNPWSTCGESAIAEAAAVRLALFPTGIRLTPYGDLESLSAQVRVIKQRGRQRDESIPLELTTQGPRRAVDLLTLGRLSGTLEESSAGIHLYGELLGATVAQAYRALEADTRLAQELEERVGQEWHQRR